MVQRIHIIAMFVSQTLHKSSRSALNIGLFLCPTTYRKDIGGCLRNPQGFSCVMFASVGIRFFDAKNLTLAV